MDIFAMMDTMCNFFAQYGFLALPHCTLIYLGRVSMGGLSLGVSIPSSVFEMEDGGEILPALYKTLYNEMLGYLEFMRSNVIVFFDGRIDAINMSMSPNQDTYAVPFRLREIEAGKSLDDLVREKRHTYEQLQFADRMRPDALSMLKGRARALVTSAKSPEWSERPKPECLVDPPATSMCRREHIDSALKCARELLEWFSDGQIVEFGKRDAERALRRPLHGKSGNGGGVEDALGILIAGSYIQKCPPPRIVSRGRRPSPWYLVNPAVEADSIPKKEPVSR